MISDIECGMRRLVSESITRTYLRNINQGRTITMKIKNTEELTLLEEMYAMAMDRARDDTTRQGAAKIVMPYLYKKMPVSTEVEVKGNQGIIDALKEIYGMNPQTQAEADAKQN